MEVALREAVWESALGRSICRAGRRPRAPLDLFGVRGPVFSVSVVYRCEVTSVGGLVQLLGASYLARGYVFYVMGYIPEGKAPEAIDQKLLARYDIGVSKWARARRKAQGQASIGYLRHERLFLLLATHGEHRFFLDEGKQIRDARRVPIKFAGYALSHRGGHAHVRIEQGRYNELKAYLLNLARHRRPETIAAEFARLPFEPYAPVRRQLLCLLRAVNEVRKAAGFAAIDSTCLRLKRHIYRPFEPAGSPEKLTVDVQPNGRYHEGTP